MCQSKSEEVLIGITGNNNDKTNFSQPGLAPVRKTMRPFFVRSIVEAKNPTYLGALGFGAAELYLALY